MRKALRVIGILPLLLFTMGQQGCDLKSPTEIRQQVDDAMHPYFPAAKTYIFKDQQEIVAYSCVSGVGPALLEKVVQTVPTLPGIDKLAELRQYKSFAATYRYLAIKFPNRIVFYDVDTGRTSIESDNSASYRSDYAKVCSRPGY